MGLDQVTQCIERFDILVKDLSKNHRVETLAPYVHVIFPQSGAAFKKGDRDVLLSFTVLIHGTEVAGLAVLVELLEQINNGQIQLGGPVGIALGNTAAAMKGVRFIDRDLNRSFGRESRETLEDRRADELELLLKRSWRFFDFHQVKLTIDRPFWVFPYTKSGYEFARLIAPDVTLITHWGKGFSNDGQCSDEWVNRNGGTGVTMELGQNGFDPAQIKHGVDVAKRAFEIANLQSENHSIPPNSKPKSTLYTWGEIIPYPETGAPVLDPGWSNFKVVQAGQRLGSFNGQDICASVTGPIVFPKYPDPKPDGSYGSEKPAAELVRILREITEDELPI